MFLLPLFNFYNQQFKEFIYNLLKIPQQFRKFLFRLSLKINVFNITGYQLVIVFALSKIILFSK